MPKDQPKLSSTQSHLPFAAIEEGVVVMRDGSYRAVISVGSVNFMLKSEGEQQAIIMAYQGFLNSLEYHVQIVLQSRFLDLEPYLKRLEERVPTQKNELIKQQTTDYIAYVRELIGMANIMDKKFYVVVPYVPVAVNKGFFGSLFSRNKSANITVDEKLFQTHKDELLQRANVVAGGLASIGLKTAVLDTDDIIRLYYSVYNYEVAVEERLDQPEALGGDVVRSKTEAELPSDQNQPAEQEV